ncbi:MAG TPA: hypothetical protein VJ873_02060, partial [bacterium]|nr:hypothetical protein [bacterium]
FGISLWMVAAFALAEETAPSSPVTATVSTPTPFPLIQKWDGAKVPWDGWFKADPYSVIVTDKGDYVHFFWNAQDFKANFEVKDKKQCLAQAALQLVTRLYPDGAKADAVKVDIVYVLQRDNYGKPNWDTLQQVAHFEFLRSKALKAAKPKKKLSPAALQKIFDQSVVY